MNLTEHFTLAELTATSHRQFDNTPNEKELANLQKLAEFLEQVKTTLDGKPIMVNSAFRSKQVNDSVGSKDTSQHRTGCAADIRVPGMTPDAVVRALVASALPFDQIIREFDAWTHISISETPRRQALIIDRAGTRPFA
jgi:zinc D-Ala-D-Ala carboxypeptidase